ncbi:MAG: hypothetical protein HC822_03815 [Oscillochloris sp.]|nr:hypothetical protein [Oscillochloris sp.]
MSNPDPFEAQAREMARLRSANGRLKAMAEPELGEMPELRTQMQQTLAAFAEWRQQLRPFTRKSRRRRFRWNLRVRRGRLWLMMRFHQALIRLRLAILGASFLLIWPVVWRVGLLIIVVIAAFSGLNWLLTNLDQVRQFFQG